MLKAGFFKDNKIEDSHIGLSPDTSRNCKINSTGTQNSLSFNYFD